MVAKLKEKHSAMWAKYRYMKANEMYVQCPA